MDHYGQEEIQTEDYGHVVVDIYELQEGGYVAYPSNNNDLQLPRLERTDPPASTPQGAVDNLRRLIEGQ